MILQWNSKWEISAIKTFRTGRRLHMAISNFMIGSELAFWTLPNKWYGHKRLPLAQLRLVEKSLDCLIHLIMVNTMVYICMMINQSNLIKMIFFTLSASVTFFLTIITAAYSIPCSDYPGLSEISSLFNQLVHPYIHWHRIIGKELLCTSSMSSKQIMYSF